MEYTNSEVIQSDSNEMTAEKTDPIVEISAMTEVANALKPLDQDAVRRILHWASDRFGGEELVIRGSERNTEKDDPELDEDDFQTQSTERHFETIADLFAAADPKNDAEKALVVAHWFQKENNQTDFDAASVNKELKHMGHGVSNITNALSSLMGRKPQLVIQLKKSGNSQQARKKYKMTLEGSSVVESMLNGGAE